MLDIDRLTLRIAGISETDARQLVALLARHLVAATPPDLHGNAEALAVSITAGSGESIDALARRIADEMLRSIARSLP